ncbi:hypothetical protein KJ700_00810, partial [Patescibacteria group bacterium]|nr:hypothetical protein [Patescibacteria group bacterium]
FLFSKYQKTLKKYTRYNNGFTVIEMLISAGIIAFLTTIFLVNYHGVSFKTELIIEAQKVVSNLNLTRSFSLSSRKYDKKVPAGGWGVYFSSLYSDRYLIFADVNNDNTYNLNEADEANEALGGRIIKLPNKVIIDSMSVCTGDNCTEKVENSVSVVFVSPNPTIYINKATSTSARIKFKETGSNSTKTIEINSLGLSEVID